jgi:molybdopterin-guanine dinucleotide biosynthesis protein A
VLLAGGLARRMGGGDKPMRTIGGRTILERVIARLTPQCDGLILNANGDPARFSAFGLSVVADGVGDFRAPCRHFSRAGLGRDPSARRIAGAERRRRLPVPAARSGFAFV